MNVFDRLAKKLQRDRTAMNEDYHQFNYIKDEVFKVTKYLCGHVLKLNNLGWQQIIRSSV